MRLAAVVLALSLLVSIDVSGEKCPEGMVWGGGRCEHENLCPDGRPASKGHLCRDNFTSIDNSSPEDTFPSGGGSENPCSGKTLFIRSQASLSSGTDDTAEGRQVLLSDGKAFELLEKYRRDIERRGGRLDYESLTVIFRQNGKTFRLSGNAEVVVDLQSLFAGRTHKQIWEKKLQYVVAEAIRKPEAVARRLKVDLICGKDEDLVNVEERN